jgi:hypothetical protein
MDNFHPRHPANPTAAAHRTVRGGVEGMRLHSRFPAMICPILHLHPEVPAAALEDKTPACLEPPSEATIHMILMGSAPVSSLAARMTAARLWDVPFVAAAIPTSPVAVMIRVIPAGRGNPHAHPVRRITIVASRVSRISATRRMAIRRGVADPSTHAGSRIDVVVAAHVAPVDARRESHATPGTPALSIHQYREDPR